MLGSPMLVTLFLAAVLWTLCSLLWLLRSAAPQAKYWLPLWLLATGTLAARGLLEFGRTPPPMGILLVGTTLFTIALAASPIGRRIAQQVPLAQLVGFHIFRILVEVFLDAGARAGIVPVQMSFEGRNFDMLTGITAGLVALLLARHVISERTVLVWNLLGLALLVNVVAISILSMPTPLRTFHNDPPNTFITHFPYVWLPLFLVQSALFCHVLIFQKLRLASGDLRNRVSDARY